ncbi:MAG: hypothetical protein LBR79_03990 [Oscillospiraceae bacterium]|jgi:NADH:ubiquinone oxidoreductase subunit 3 (subunit A)|nr:hypothetical protein [Oscillospiraceae bacterium]
MIADLVIITIIILLLILLIIKFIKKHKKNKGKPYSHDCGSCSIANKCLKLKNENYHGKNHL